MKIIAIKINFRKMKIPILLEIRNNNRIKFNKIKIMVTQKRIKQNLVKMILELCINLIWIKIKFQWSKNNQKLSIISIKKFKKTKTKSKLILITSKSK